MCGNTCLKYCNCIISFLFVISSLALIISGCIAAFVFILVSSSENFSTNIASPSLLVVLCGVILFIALLFGCCAFCTENFCLMITYTVLLVILSLVQIGLGAYILYNYQESNVELQKQVKIDVEKLMQSYHSDQYNTLDALQEMLKCCGVTRPHNYNVEIYQNHTLPASCCKNLASNCNIASPDKYDEGCANRLFESAIVVNQVIAILSIIVGVLELLGVVMVQVYVRC